MSERGMYIVLEGGDNVGKSTQTELLADEFGLHPVREPGGTIIGERIRSLLLDPDVDPSTNTQTMLHAAARAELLDTVVNPKIEAGLNVISDRSWISGVAYQGACGADTEDIKAVSKIVAGERFQPDLLLLLSAPPEVLAERSGIHKDYYESKGLEFQQRVHEQYLEICNDMGAIIIDATGSIEEVNHSASRQIADLLMTSM